MLAAMVATFSLSPTSAALFASAFQIAVRGGNFVFEHGSLAEQLGVIGRGAELRQNLVKRSLRSGAVCFYAARLYAL
jgi:hypothetical protein